MTGCKSTFKSTSKLEDAFIELTNAGALKLEQISFKKSAVIAVQKPESDKFGCILLLEDGSKFPVVELYDDVMRMLNQ